MLGLPNAFFATLPRDAGNVEGEPGAATSDGCIVFMHYSDFA